jgi:hypothetical protein
LLTGGATLVVVVALILLAETAKPTVKFEEVLLDFDEVAVVVVV